MTGTEPFRQIASIIALHPNREVVGAERLQSTVRLLQKGGLDTCYEYSIFATSPYSEGLQAETQLWENLGLVRQRREVLGDGSTRRVFQALKGDIVDDVLPFAGKVSALARTSTEVLRLATIYDCYREVGIRHKAALSRTERFPGASRGRLGAALWLLRCIRRTNSKAV